jgi:hypothetical protein
MKRGKPLRLLKNRIFYERPLPFAGGGRFFFTSACFYENKSATDNGAAAAEDIPAETGITDKYLAVVEWSQWLGRWSPQR